VKQVNASADLSRQFATFRVHGLLFGIEVLHVQEVLRYQEMTYVPLAPRVIRGLINLRGQIVTALDMRERLNFPHRAGEVEPMNMIVRSEDGAVSLLVDEIGDVVEVRPDSHAPVPETMGPELKQLLDGVYKLEGSLLLILNTERTLQSQDA
jgi:purine-binding chemotaxis protein CheW